MPGRITRIGSGQRSRMTWIWPGEVWVRRMTSGSVVKKVSCISRAGWNGGKLSSWKLYSSVSTSRER